MFIDNLRYIISVGVFAQLLMLLGRPIFRAAKQDDRGFRNFILSIIAVRLIWASYAYWQIWSDWHNPDQWVLNSTGFTVAIYAAIFPLAILIFDRLLLKLIGLIYAAISKKVGD